MKDKRVSRVSKVSQVPRAILFNSRGTRGTRTTRGTLLRGFTLVELLVSMTILGILTTLGLGNYLNSQMKSRDAQRKSNLTQIKNGLELYYNDYGRYPAASLSSGGQIMACPSKPTAGACAWGTGQMTDGNTNYLSQVPKDPKDPSISYFYKTSSDGSGSKYQLFARLENSNDPDITSGLSSVPAGSCGEDCNFGVTSPNTSLGESI